MPSDDSTRLALLERDVEYLKSEAQDNRELRDTVINLKQSVELLNKTVWGVLACLGSAILMIAINFIFGGVLKFWIALTSAIVLLTQQLGLNIFPENIGEIMNTILLIFTILGVIVDPTTSGITDNQTK